VKHHEAPGVGGGACQARSVSFAHITCRVVVGLRDTEFESYAVSLAAGANGRAGLGAPGDWGRLHTVIASQHDIEVNGLLVKVTLRY